MKLRFRTPRTLQAIRPRKRFVGWQPLNMQPFDALVKQKVAAARPRTISSLSTTLVEAATAVPAKARRPHPNVMAVSAIEDALRRVLRAASSSKEQRAAAHAAMPHRLPLTLFATCGLAGGPFATSADGGAVSRFSEWSDRQSRGTPT